MLEEKIERDTIELVEFSQIHYPQIGLFVKQIGRRSWFDS
jgi:hypothetical protein